LRKYQWIFASSIDDLDSQTVFLLTPAIHSNMRLTAEYDFKQSGNYIGIVTAPHPTKDILYHAVFPFKVGSTGYGYWPLILLIILLLQLLNMISQGSLQKISGEWRATMNRDKKSTVRGTK
jgi:hypothetical protein